MPAFKVGDPVWISDGYAGSPHTAIVDGLGERGQLWATSTYRIMGDSRHVEWTIQPDKIEAMVSLREGT